MHVPRRVYAVATAVATAALGVAGATSVAAAVGGSHQSSTATPIKHLVIIFQENVSFDHYFGTYPKAANTSGQRFRASSDTPKVNNLADTPGAGGTGNLLTNNPNKDSGGNQVNPRRLDPANIADVLTCDQDHGYSDEQKAFDGGKMDNFVTTVGTASGTSAVGQPCKASDVMNFYDGNTVTGIWNYAQHFAMSDNSFGTEFGPSAPGALNLISGNTGGVGKMINGADTDGDTVSDGKGGFSLINDAQPYYDDCSTRDAVSLTGQNIGDELNAAGLSWGWFQGGFRPTTTFAAATGGTQPTSTFIPDQFKGKFATKPASDQGLCNAVTPVGAGIGGTGTNFGWKDDYIAHHEPFQYYASTANPHHLAPASLAAIGTDTQTVVNGVPQFNTANHQYEQKFIVDTVNALQHTPDWSSTAVIINYDDSDGYYDHVFSGIHNTSNTSADFLTGTGLCGNTAANPPLAGQNGRCGYGPRLPLLVISPWAKRNFVAHNLTDQSSIIRFIEDNWGLPRISGSFDAIAGTLNNMFDFDHGSGHARKLFLDPITGQPLND